MPGSFVGRKSELERLNAAFDKTVAGACQLVMLVGEPGNGKTRLAEHFAATYVTENTQPHWGRCYEDQRTPHYWPWHQAIRSYLRTRDAEHALPEKEQSFRVMAAVFPFLSETLLDRKRVRRSEDSDSALPLL